MDTPDILWSTWHLRNITSLTVSYLELGTDPRIPNRDLLDILSRNMSTLEHLEIIDTAPIICMLEFPCTVTLPRLTSLSIGYVRASLMVRLVQALSLPKLRSLTVRDVTRTPEFSTPKYIWGWLGNHVKDVQMEGALGLLTALSNFPTVTHLKVSGIFGAALNPLSRSTRSNFSR